MSRRSSSGPTLRVAAALVAACAAASGCWVEEVHIEPDGWAPDGRDADGAADVPPVERCNGVDDDGDGATDEDFECVAGAEDACAEGSCAGTRTCDPTSCSWGPCDFGPPPANDTCAGALELTVSGEYAGTTCAAGNDHEPPAACAGGGGRDVWYRFVVTERETVYLDTVDGETWNSVLQIRWGDCRGGLSPVVCADDQCPGVSGGRRSQLLEVLDPGTYHVVVDGAAAAEAGAFRLRFQRASCGDPRPLTGSGNFDGTTAGREDRWAGSCGGESSPEVFYAFGLCEPRTVTASTCTPMSGFDSVLAFLGPACGATGELACNDDDAACRYGTGRSTVQADLPAGLNFLVVDGHRGASGAYRLVVTGL